MTKMGKPKKSAAEKALEALEAKKLKLELEARIKKAQEDIAAAEAALNEPESSNDPPEYESDQALAKLGNCFDFICICITFEFVLSLFYFFYVMVETTACYVCKKIVSTKNIARHVNTLHKNQKKFECNICKKKFTTKNNKNKHELTCEGC